MDLQRRPTSPVVGSLRTRKALLAALACTVCVPAYCVWSKHRMVEISVVACKPAAFDSDAEAVHGYPGPPERLPAALGGVWFTTDVTLESLTACTHHHYFRLVVPGGKSDEGEIWSGAIYRASAEEQAAHGASSPLYKAWFPLELERLRQHASSIGGADGETLLDRVRQMGIRLHLGGGRMWGAGSLSSNEVALPLTIADGGRLVLRG